MWGQVGIKKALKAYLSGKPVKVVDLSAETVLTLQEVLQNFEAGCFFFIEQVAVENLEFSEAVEEMTADLLPIADVVRGTVAIEENGDIRITRARPVNTAHGLVEDCTAPDPEQTPPPKPKKVHTKKTVEETEREYQTRKIDDLGKLRSLRDAGWSAAKIADEFRCSKVTVYNTLKKLEAEA